METKEIYDLIRCAQKETRDAILKEMRKALMAEDSRYISKEKFSQKEQDAYIKGLESAQKLIYNTI